MLAIIVRALFNNSTMIRTKINQLPEVLFVYSKLLVFVCALLFLVTQLEAQNQQSVIVKGKVTEPAGVQLVGVTVTVSSNNVSVVTDAHGEFTIQSPVLDTLVFSHVNYSILKMPVLNDNIMNVVLQPLEGSMEEVQVVGFGRQRRVTVTGAVQSVKPEELRIPTANLSNALAGRLSGVIAVQRTGAPGADGSTFYIRGLSTYSGANDPLILLDGIRISNGDLNSLSPEIIESVSVLKDATATAMYGTRGANGVLIVTTKLGKESTKPGINIRVQNQVSTPTSVPKFVDGIRYMELFNEAVTGRGTGEILYSRDKIEGTRLGLDPYAYPNVDWYNSLFKPYTMNQEANLTVQGGGKTVGYFLSAAANHSNGLLKNFDLNSYDNNIKLRRYVFQNNINATLSPTTKVALRLNTQLRYYHGANTGDQATFGNIMNANPVDFPLYWRLDSTGDRRNVRYGGRSGGTVNNGFPNPFAQMVNGYSDNFQSTVLATLDGEQKLDVITRGLSFKALVSFKNWSSTTVGRSSGYNQYEITGPITKNPDGTYDYVLGMVGQPQGLQLGTSTSATGDREIYIQPSLDYTRAFGQHNVSAMLLYNQTDYNLNSPDGLINSLPRRRQGYSGRLNYQFAAKYLIEANFGYNGSENFAPGHRWGFFPSFSVGYVVSNESFWESLYETINLFKIRASWGKAGNDQIGGVRFPYLSDINLSGRGYTTGVDQNFSLSGPTYTQFANPLITWEISTDMNLGVDVGIKKEFNLVVDIFKRHRKNIFDNLSAVIPNAFGIAGTNVYSNIGEAESKGLEVALEWNKAFSRDFQIMSRGTFSYARSKIIKNNEPAFTVYRNLSAVGYPIGTQLGYLAERLFIDQAEIANSPIQQLGGFVTSGDIKYTDVTAFDGLNLINSDDRVRMGYPTTPEIVYGWSNTFRYKAVDLSFLLQGVARTSFFISGFHPFGSQGIRSILEFVADATGLLLILIFMQDTHA